MNSNLVVGDLLLVFLGTYRQILFIFIILSFLQSLAGLALPAAMRPAANFVYDVSEPFLRIFRSMLPSVNLGGMGLDLSPILAFIVLQIAFAIVVGHVPHHV